MNNQSAVRKYLTIDDIQKEYLHIGKKRLRMLVKKYLETKVIGNRIFVERAELENLMTDSVNNIV